MSIAIHSFIIRIITVIYTFLVFIDVYNVLSSCSSRVIDTKVGQNVSLLFVYFGSYIFSHNEGGSDVSVLLSHFFSTYSPPQLRHLSYGGRSILFPVDISARPVLSAVVSQLFALRDLLYIRGRQDSASALET